ncbi:MAG TPA: pyridoxal phosphate-dependent aminotransferase [Lentisphaeria bacterium]|nr:MAG: aromatic amino acid aminotransferase [Lentisphaerae bacterium GWF2_50_93]HCE44790.1 pyridoxal phosphate-dependent aminotransferase [Lentisphaeria bacterium]
MKNRVAEHIAVLPKSGIRDFFELVNSMGNEVISLGIGEPDFVTPWHIRESAIFAMEKGHTSYTSNLGLLSMRQEVCKYVDKNYKAKYNPVSECIITVGVSEALDLIFRAIITPGDEIIYHEPCYVSYAPEIKMAHGVPVAVVTKEKNKFALDPKDFEKAVTPKTKAILLNFPCNPTGASLTPEDVREIARIAKKHDLIVITDEIYSELTYDGKHSSIASLPGMKERTIFLHGFSKAYAMTGFRMGYACGPADLIDAMMKIHQYSMLCASIIAQESAIEALRNGKTEMEKMKDEYCRRRNMIVKRLNEIGLKCVMPKGAFYAFPNITSSGLSSKEFATRLLQEEKVAVVPGTAFGECGEGYVRCAYATSFEDIEEAMRRIEKFVKKLK